MVGSKKRGQKCETPKLTKRKLSLTSDLNENESDEQIKILKKEDKDAPDSNKNESVEQVNKVKEEDEKMSSPNQNSSDLNENSDEMEATNTSDTDEGDSNNEEDQKTQEANKKSTAETETERIRQRYNDRRGKQLYLRFPNRIPEDQEKFEKKVLGLSPLIKKVHRPRQKYARFCLLDFESQKDRDTTLEKFQLLIQQKKKHFLRLSVSIPRTDDPDFVAKLVEKKLNTIKTRKTKAKLKRASKLAKTNKHRTSSIVISNMPRHATSVAIEKLFPDAVDIQFKSNKHIMSETVTVFINLPSTIDARNAVKRELLYNGIPLNIRYAKITDMGKGH